jgi:hypothetical protein
VKVLVEKPELVAKCLVPDGRIGVEVQVRPRVDPQRAVGGGVDERPGAVDRGLPVLLRSAHKQGCLKSGRINAGRYRSIWSSPRGATWFFHRVATSPPVNVWIWRSVSGVAVTASAPGLPTIGM